MSVYVTPLLGIEEHERTPGHLAMKYSMSNRYWHKNWNGVWVYLFAYVVPLDDKGPLPKNWVIA